MQAHSDVRGLIAALSDVNPATRRAAATALRSLVATTAIPGVQDALLRESEPDVREVLVTTLELLFSQNKGSTEAQSGDSSNVVRLISRLSGTHTEQAVRAAQELGESREKLTVEALLLTFNNRKLAARVRLAVAEALLKLQSAPTEITLLAALRSERWMIRRNAAGVLGQLEADWAVEPLMTALRDPIEAVRRVAKAALERIGTPEALAAISLPLPTADLKSATHPAASAPSTTHPNLQSHEVPVPTKIIIKPHVPASPDSDSENKPPVASTAEGKQPLASSEGAVANPLPTSPEPLPQSGKPRIFNWSTMLTDPLLDEEDTKPIRPLPDDVS